MVHFTWQARQKTKWSYSPSPNTYRREEIVKKNKCRVSDVFAFFFSCSGVCLREKDEMGRRAIPLFLTERWTKRERVRVHIWALYFSSLLRSLLFHQAFDSEKRSPVSMLACLFACARAYIKGRPFSLFFWCDRKTASLDHAVVIRHTLTYCLRRGATQHQEREREIVAFNAVVDTAFFFSLLVPMLGICLHALLLNSLSHVILVMLMFFLFGIVSFFSESGKMKAGAPHHLLSVSIDLYLYT